MKNSVLYPGSFDPITKGHMEIIDQALELFDWVVIGVLNNSQKKESMFNLMKRYDMLCELYHNIYKGKNIVISAADENQTAVQLALEEECSAIVRGVRNIRDFDYELEMQQTNRELSDNKIKTICLFPSQENLFVSSSKVKEIFYHGGDISRYVDPYVEAEMKKIMKR